MKITGSKDIYRKRKQLRNTNVSAQQHYQPYIENVTAPSFDVPEGACDTHFHVFDHEKIYPFTESRSYTPTKAPLEAYKAMCSALGITRHVIVQPSVYGLDNRMTLQVLQDLGQAARGIAVIDESFNEGQLKQFHQAGVRGVRMNLLFKGGISKDQIHSIAKKIAPFGWHLQCLVDVSSFDNIHALTKNLPVPIVIDHMGHLSTQHGVSNTGFQSLLRSLDTDRCWVKMSGTYRLTQEKTVPYNDVIPFAKALIKTRTDRLVWGSDWPHPSINVPMPNSGDLLNLLPLWTNDTEILQRILVDNPAKLYNFED
jgi:predicted TIM-barrel fold metal-dependent hydrolase